jgi:hypothetical protein
MVIVSLVCGLTTNVFMIIFVWCRVLLSLFEIDAFINMISDPTSIPNIFRVSQSVDREVDPIYVQTVHGARVVPAGQEGITCFGGVNGACMITEEGEGVVVVGLGDGACSNGEGTTIDCCEIGLMIGLEVGDGNGF